MTKIKVECPKCRKSIQWSQEFPWRPFCSERCKLMDLGEWASDHYVISGEQQHVSSNDNEQDEYGDYS